MGAIDHGARHGAGFGCYSQAILDLEGTIDVAALRAALDQISLRFPLIHGRVARDWLNLAPYWTAPRQGGPDHAEPLPLSVVQASSHEEAERLLDEHANARFDSESDHLRFLLIQINSARSRLGMVFDHRLLDAFGAESLLRLIDQTWQRRLDGIWPRVKQTAPANLDHWQRRFLSGRTLNRYLFSLSRQPICALDKPLSHPRPAIRFLHESLTAQETADFNRRAAEEIGLPIILPSAAARAIVALRQAMPIMPLAGEQITLFTTVNTRLPGQEWEKLFFNHLSLMTLSAGASTPSTAAAIASALRDQFIEQTRLQIPFVMEDAGALGRICPHWIGSRLMRLVNDGRLCTFYFVCLRENGFAGSSFLGQPVANLRHKPLTFFPPGLNVCITSFANRFNLVVSYLEGSLPDAAAERLLNEFKAALLE
jgi:hypothetical protein